MFAGTAHAHSERRQSKQSQGQPSAAGQGEGKPHVELTAVLNSRYKGSSGITAPVLARVAASSLKTSSPSRDLYMHKVRPYAG